MTRLIALPYTSAHTYKVAQTWGGSYSHTGALYWGVDFYFGFGDEVLAVDDGVVVESKYTVPDGSSYCLNSSDASYGTSGIGNFVTLRHMDGLYSTYCHLQQNSGALVKDASVRRGDMVGKVGHTGLRTNTHLHIHVGWSSIAWRAGQIANGVGAGTPPAYFDAVRDGNGVVCTPACGSEYTGDNSTGPRPPSEVAQILSFDVQPRVVVKGESVEVNWSASGTKKVWIAHVGEYLAEQGSQPVVTDEAGTKDFSMAVIGTDEGKLETDTITVTVLESLAELLQSMNEGGSLDGLIQQYLGTAPASDAYDSAVGDAAQCCPAPETYGMSGATLLAVLQALEAGAGFVPSGDPCALKKLTVSAGSRSVELPGATDVLEVVAGWEDKPTDIECKAEMADGPCGDHGDGRVLDVNYPADAEESAEEERSGTDLSFKALCEPPPSVLDGLVQYFTFFWPSEPTVRSYDILASTCGIPESKDICTSQAARVNVYPNVKWTVEVYPFGYFESDKDISQDGGKLTKYTETTYSPPTFKVSVEWDNQSLELGPDFEFKASKLLSAVNSCTEVADKMKGVLGRIGIDAPTIQYPRFSLIGEWGWEELDDRPECAFLYDVTLELSPLIGVSWEIDLIGVLEKFTGPVGGGIAALRTLLETSGRGDLFLDFIADASLCGKYTFKDYKGEVEIEVTDAGEISVPIEFTLRGGGEINFNVWFFHAGAHMEFGGSTGIELLIKGFVRDDNTYLEGTVNFLGATVYASGYVGTNCSLGSSSTGSAESMFQSEKETEMEAAPVDFEHEWVILEEEKLFDLFETKITKNEDEEE